MIAGALLEPLFHDRVFVRAVVVQDQMDVQSGIYRSVDFVKE